jgi:hypothetical protein
MCLCSTPFHSIAHALEKPSVVQATVSYPLSSHYYPVVLQGRDLPPLLDVPIDRISLYAFRDNTLGPIPFQIDRRDRKGRFQIPADENDLLTEKGALFDENDECVFMVSDAGGKPAALPAGLNISLAVEIILTDREDGRNLRVYALVSPEATGDTAAQDYVTYHGEDDSVESETYRVSFSSKKPFLIDTILWKEAVTHRYAPNFTDTAKIRHRGKLFRQFDFLRTQADYKSRLVAVKDGPVRVIRRTVNKIRVLWKLRTPSILIDSIHYANAFYMDTILDLPFRPGLFFSDIETVLTIDGRDISSLPLTKVYNEAASGGVIIDGKMAEEEENLNRSGGSSLIVSNRFGKILVALEFDKDSPISAASYLVDDVQRPDPPENVPGQFGNLGFITTGWEQIDTSVHHLVFTVYMIRDVSLEEGFKILKKSPSLIR